MKIFDSKQPANTSESVAAPIQANPISQADQNCKVAGEAVKASLLELGQKYFEANKDNEKADFLEIISNLKNSIEKEALWKQYRLSLDGKTMCENCGAIITSDSAFCNKCGGVIKPRDFSSIGVAANQNSIAVDNNLCPSCGSPLMAGARFCEKCGNKI